MTAHIFTFPIKRKQARETTVNGQQRLAAHASHIVQPEENIMNIAHRITARPVVTMAAERGVRIRAATRITDIDIAISPAQAEQLRRDLDAVLARMKREATPLPAPSGPSGGS